MAKASPRVALNDGYRTVCFICRLLTFLGLAMLCAAQDVTDQKPSSTVRIGRTPVPGGGELLTYFRTVTDPSTGPVEVPLISVLRDTLGDSNPENDRLRNVWAFTCARPSVWRRVAAAVPFLYGRMGRPSANGVPRPIVDMAAAGRGTIPRLIGDVAQRNAFDPLGIPYRATTRAYRSRVGEYRTMQVWRTLDVLAETWPSTTALSDADLTRLRGRVLLARLPMGGWVSERYVAPAWRRFETMSSEDRGWNWDLLRQKAEENGLFFQPLKRTGTGPAFAMLWIADPSKSEPPARFDSKFLNISDPFRDSRLRRWRGYTETRWLDATDSPVAAGTEGSHPVRMIPLALYALDHPKVPLLLVDFRDPRKPWRREMIRRAADEITTGVLGWTGFANLPYFAAKMSWSFVHGRHGGALDRSARLRAYVELRQALLADLEITPDLRHEVSGRLELLGLNPFDSSSRAMQQIALRQYQALMANAESGGLSSTLSRQRAREVSPLLHSRGKRAIFRTATLATFGIYRHREPQTPELLALVDRQRRIDWHLSYLRGVLEAGPHPEVAADMRAIRHSVDELTALAAELPQMQNDVAQVVSAIMAHSDEATRADCMRSLSRLVDAR